MKLIYLFLLLIGVVIITLALGFGNKFTVKSISKDVVSSHPKTLIRKNDATELLNKVTQRYLAFIYYKTKGKNTYFEKGIGEQVSVQREIYFEYEFPSKVKAEINDGNELKKLVSEGNNAKLYKDDSLAENYDDIYWGLGSFEFGKGVFFEVAKILILKERGGNTISSFNNLVDPQIIGEEEINGKICYRLQGQIKSDELTQISYWIDKETLIIRQYEQLMLMRKIPNGYFKTIETYYEIEAR